MGHSRKIIGGSLVIAIFVLVVSLTSWYVQLQIDSGTICSCAIPLPVLIPFVSSIGLLVGTFVYYMFSSEKGGEIGTEILFDLLTKDEADVMKVIVEEGGEISQAKIVSFTGMPKVRVFRIIERLKRKGIISKEPYGKTNLVKLRDDIKKVFVGS